MRLPIDSADRNPRCMTTFLPGQSVADLAASLGFGARQQHVNSHCSRTADADMQAPAVDSATDDCKEPSTQTQVSESMSIAGGFAGTGAEVGLAVPGGVIQPLREAAGGGFVSDHDHDVHASVHYSATEVAAIGIFPTSEALVPFPRGDVTPELRRKLSKARSRAEGTLLLGSECSEQSAVGTKGQAVDFA